MEFPEEVVYLAGGKGRSQEDFYRKYVTPLGTPRMGATGEGEGGLELQVNAAGAMELVWALIFVSSEKDGGWELLPKMKYPTGDWIGDLEPGSVWSGFWLKEDDESIIGRHAFQHHVTRLRTVDGEARVNWEDGAILRVEVSGVEAEPLYGVIGNVAALHSLARHLSNLAHPDTPDGSRVHYEPGLDLEAGSLPLAISRTGFE